MKSEEKTAQELAKSVTHLSNSALRRFVGELSRARKGFLEDFADVVVSLSRHRQPRRSYDQFWSELKKGHPG